MQAWHNGSLQQQDTHKPIPFSVLVWLFYAKSHPDMTDQGAITGIPVVVRNFPGTQIMETSNWLIRLYMIPTESRCQRLHNERQNSDAQIDINCQPMSHKRNILLPPRDCQQPAPDNFITQRIQTLYFIIPSHVDHLNGLRVLSFSQPFEDQFL